MDVPDDGGQACVQSCFIHATRDERQCRCYRNHLAHPYVEVPLIDVAESPSRTTDMRHERAGDELVKDTTTWRMILHSSNEVPATEPMYAPVLGKMSKMQGPPYPGIH